MPVGDRVVIMRDDVLCEFPGGYEGAPVLERLGQVLDPELDESILDLGFVRRVTLQSGHAEVALQLPTSWCAVNFAYLMAEEVRQALLTLESIGRVTVRLGNHCAAAEIEAAVNAGRPFAEAFPGEGGGSLTALRLTFLRKGFFIRQERLLRELRQAGCSPTGICALRIGEVSMRDGTIVIERPDGARLGSGSGAVLQFYLARRAELGLDCNPAAPLIVRLDGMPFSPEQLQAHYESARTMRVALEANGAFCRALIARATGDAAERPAP
ncbi:MAG: iron-sulfur cluster assembly protein [Alphaproteobacteria bacterium]|nr:iron-sulfur cluster assembly protein [Alphaproteobacteria bacterium]